MTLSTYAEIVREVLPEDLEYLAENLRKADILELEATYGRDQSILGALDFSVALSDYSRVCVTKDGIPAMVCGVGRVQDDSAMIWAVGTNGVRENPRLFLEHSPTLLKEWFKTLGVSLFWNYTHAANKVHHRWLKSLGTLLLLEETRGPLGEPFIPFIIKRSSLIPE
ncbi:MAG: hypothetical protein JKY49_00470 [Cohaesibacteraceae bacterium]|nr:hypothetical protein [Cohaesibacteraceae bacterium]MBL4875773.1 hypothetical protein [Cohaesibacteraceae bacterium]